jgi:hypothetical protein
VHRLGATVVAALAACGPAVSDGPPRPSAPMSALETSAVGCWLVAAPQLGGQAWHLRLDSVAWRTDSVVCLRGAVSIQASRHVGTRGFWLKSLRYPDSVEVTLGMVPGDAMMLRLAPGRGGLRGSAWGLEDVAPMESLIGPAELIPAPCAT